MSAMSRFESSRFDESRDRRDGDNSSGMMRSRFGYADKKDDDREYYQSRTYTTGTTTNSTKPTTGDYSNQDYTYTNKYSYDRQYPENNNTYNKNYTTEYTYNQPQYYRSSEYYRPSEYSYRPSGDLYYRYPYYRYDQQSTPRPSYGQDQPMPSFYTHDMTMNKPYYTEYSRPSYYGQGEENNTNNNTYYTKSYSMIPSKYFPTSEYSRPYNYNNINTEYTRPYSYDREYYPKSYSNYMTEEYNRPYSMIKPYYTSEYSRPYGYTSEYSRPTEEYNRPSTYYTSEYSRPYNYPRPYYYGQERPCESYNMTMPYYPRLSLSFDQEYNRPSQMMNYGCEYTRPYNCGSYETPRYNKPYSYNMTFDNEYRRPYGSSEEYKYNKYPMMMNESRYNF